MGSLVGYHWNWMHFVDEVRLGLRGRASHGRQRPAGMGQRTEKRHASSLEAPRWLCSSLLDLAAVHEVAYLDHCSRYALDVSA
jgi:uncharacterized protein (DUF2252 family)